jgi:Flp pilus assembly protein TadG
MSRLRNLIRNERGAAAMMFGLAAVPITVAAGGALDFTRAGVERAELQANADSAALGAVLARNATSAQRGDIAKQYFRASDVVTPVITGPTVTAEVTASRDMKTTLLSIVGKKTLTIGAKAKAVRTMTGPPACAIALNKAAAGAIDFSGASGFKAPT